MKKSNEDWSVGFFSKMRKIVWYNLLDPCDPQTINILGFPHWDNVFSSTRISSDMICPTVLDLGKTSSKPVNTLSAKRLAILLTNPGWVSDSWTMIFLWTNAAANTTGKATYPHLQNTTSTRYRKSRKSDWKKPAIKRKISRIFLYLDIRSVSLRYLPDKMGMNVNRGIFAEIASYTWYSRLFADPNQ